MDHDYALPARSVKRKRTGEINDPRRFWDKRRNKTKVNIGVAFPRWRELRDKLNLQRDAELACILINRYASIQLTISIRIFCETMMSCVKRRRTSSHV